MTKIESLPALMLVVAGALIRPDGTVLVQQRPAGKQLAGLWEFPGGKIEIGESPEAALVRELREELAIEVNSGALSPVTFASEALAGRHLVLMLFAVRAWHGDPLALAADALRWVSPCDMATLPMPPADVPLVAALATMLGRSG